MIFWMGFEKRPNFLVQVLYVENVSYKVKKRGDVSRNFGLKLCHYGGSHFLNRVAFDYGDRVVAYWNMEFTSQIERKKEFEMHIYTEKDKIADMPEHVLVKTNNLDFIRELFDLGKKVSWYDPDLNFFGSELALFDFEHLFLDLFNTDKIILPTGKIIPNVDEFGKMFIDYKLPTNGVKFGKRIGYWPKVLRRRVYKMAYVRASAKQIMRGVKRPANITRGDKWYLFSESYRVYYNLLSITYMLWHKSIVASAQSKTAPQD